MLPQRTQIAQAAFSRRPHRRKFSERRKTVVPPCLHSHSPQVLFQVPKSRSYSSVMRASSTNGVNGSHSDKPQVPPIELLFLGTGASSSIPHLDCLTAPPNKKPCLTCLSTLTPEGKKNIRRNTSAALRIPGKNGKTT